MSRRFLQVRRRLVTVLAASSLLCVASRAEANLYRVQTNGFPAYRWDPGRPAGEVFPSEVPAFSAEWVASMSAWDGETVMPPINASFLTDTTFKIRVEAPAGYLFRVTPPAGATRKDLFVQLYSNGEIPMPHGHWVQTGLVFEGCNAPPLEVDHAEYYSTESGDFGIYMYFGLQGELSFTALEVSYTVPAAYGATFANRTPALASQVLFEVNLPYGATDPGPWVKVVPIDSRASVFDILATLRSFGLPAGTEGSLAAKLEAAANSLDNGNVTSALNQLQAFLHAVEAKRGKALTTAQADELLGAVKLLAFALSS
jgi:hypothetical protein